MQHKTTRDLANATLTAFKQEYRDKLVHTMTKDTTLGEIDKIVELAASSLNTALWKGEEYLKYEEFFKNQSYVKPQE